MEKIPKIIFWGTSDFAIPTLETLINNGYEIVTVITNPDEPVGRKKIITPPPVKIAAERYKIPIYQPENLKSYHLPPTTYPPDLFIVASYGKIIPKSILEMSRLGTLNIHPSLLPRWRGPSPVQYTVLSGDKKTGVTIMKIDELMDHGPIIATSEKIQVTRNTKYKELLDQLSQIGAELLIDTLPKYLNGEIKPIPQDHSKATYSKILSKEDGHVDWSKSAEEIDRMVRALNPWPGVWSITDFKRINKRLSIEEAENISEEHSSRQIGFTWQTKPDELCIQTSHGSLKILRLTLEGKKSTSAVDFLRGNKDILGKILK